MAWTNSMSLPHPSAFDLRGRQSVRATFRLSPQAIEALSIVAAHLGIKQKSIFDHLIEDAASLMLIAREADDKSWKDQERVQKTFVISRKTLISIEKTADTFGVSRDALVELSIQRLLPVISRERQKHMRRKRILNDIKGFLGKGMELLAEFETVLGDEDPTTANFKVAIKALAAAQNEISGFVNKGEMIENFNFQHVAVNTKRRNDSLRDDLNKNL